MAHPIETRPKCPRCGSEIETQDNIQMRTVHGPVGTLPKYEFHTPGIDWNVVKAICTNPRCDFVKAK